MTRLRSPLAAMPLVLVSVLTAGCGGEDETASPTDVAKRYYLSSQDPAARCATLAESSVNAFGGREQCEKRTLPSTEKPGKVTIDKELITGDKACVRFKVRGGGVGIVTLVKEEGDWKVDGLGSGVEPTSARVRRCAPARGPKRE